MKKQKVGIVRLPWGSARPISDDHQHREPVKSPKVSIHSMIIVFAFILSLVGRSPDDQRACSVQVT